MKETTGAAVTEEGGGSVGHLCPHVVWGGRLRRVDTLGGVKTSQSCRHYNIYLANDDGKKGSFIHLITIETTSLY